MPRKNKIVIYGGAFNPPHIGHAIVIEALLRLIKADEIWIMPSADRLDKHIGITGKDRVNMLRLMVEEFFPKPKIIVAVSPFEINRPELTTTYDTLSLLKKNHSDSKFFFVIGSELVKDIKTKWVKGKELYRSADFIVVRRSFNHFPTRTPSNFTLLETEGIWPDLSSTFLRKILKEGYSGLPYISKDVSAYISKRKLYRK